MLPRTASLLSRPLSLAGRSAWNGIFFVYGGVQGAGGAGTSKDAEQAVYWYTKAAEQGNTKAQYQLGHMYSEGRGALKDSVLAYVWWNIAASQYEHDAARKRDIIEKEMTPEQRTRAQKLSREYYAKI